MRDARSFVLDGDRERMMYRQEGEHEQKWQLDEQSDHSD